MKIKVRNLRKIIREELSRLKTINEAFAVITVDDKGIDNALGRFAQQMYTTAGGFPALLGAQGYLTSDSAGPLSLLNVLGVLEGVANKTIASDSKDYKELPSRLYAVHREVANAHDFISEHISLFEKKDDEMSDSERYEAQRAGKDYRALAENLRSYAKGLMSLVKALAALRNADSSDEYVDKATDRVSDYAEWFTSGGERSAGDYDIAGQVISLAPAKGKKMTSQLIDIARDNDMSIS